MISNYRLKIYGRVQAVNFRYNIKKLAQESNISGWVRNVVDGTVEAEIEGEENKLQKLIEYCKSGPRRAKVNKIDIIEDAFKKYQDFKILFS